MNYSWTLYIIITFLFSTLATFLAMPILLRLCRRKGIYDIPDERKVHHSNNIPRLGGVLFIPAMLIGASMAMVAMVLLEGRDFIPLKFSTIFIVIGMFLLYIIGLLDDLFSMPAQLKFLIQIIASLFLPFCGLYVHNLYGLFGLYEIPLWAAYPLTVFISLLIVNAINLIDGIDGLSSGLAITAILTFTVLFIRHDMMFYVLYCMGILGPVLVFFFYNMFGKAEKGTKTFMGDTGSLTLGFALAFLAIRYIMTCTSTNIETMHDTALLVPYTLLIVPCFDLIRVAVMRIYRGFPVFHPDKTHIHHKCLRAGFTMHQSLAIIIALQLFFTGINGSMILLDWHISVIVLTDIATFVLFNLWLNRRIRSLAAQDAH